MVDDETTSLSATQPTRRSSSPNHPTPNDPATETYLTLLLHNIDHVASHLQPHRCYHDPAYTPSEYPIAGPSWSQVELDLFFNALARHSRLRPDLIAKEVRTKTLPQVCLYIQALQQGAAHVEAAEIDAALAQARARTLHHDSQSADQQLDQLRQAKRPASSSTSSESSEASQTGGDRTDRSRSDSHAEQPGGSDDPEAAGSVERSSLCSPAIGTVSGSKGDPAIAPADAATATMDKSRCRSERPNRKQIGRALVRLREHRWRLLPSAKEVGSDWIEFEESQAEVIAERSALVEERLSVLKKASSAPIDTATSNDGAASVAAGFPSEAEQRAMMLYVASLPVSYDEQVAATMIFLRHRPRLDPARSANATLVGSPDEQPQASEERVYSVPLRTFTRARAVGAIITDDGIVSKDYIAFCATHPAVPVTTPQDVERALTRGVELGFVAALEAVDDEALQEADDPSTSTKRTRRVLRLQDQKDAELPRSIDSHATSIDHDAASARLCWADSIGDATAMATAAPFRQLVKMAERGSRLFLRARQEARSRLLSSLTSTDLLQCAEAYRQVNVSAPRAEGVQPPSEGIANGARESAPETLTNPAVPAAPEAGAPAQKNAAHERGSRAELGALDATADGATPAKPSGKRFIFKGQDMGIDLSQMSPKVQQSVKGRIRSYVHTSGMQAALDYASRLDKDGQLSVTRKKAVKAGDEVPQTWIFHGQDMGVDFSSLSKSEFKIMTHRIRDRVRTKGMDDALSFCAKLQEGLSQGRALDDLVAELTRMKKYSTKPKAAEQQSSAADPDKAPPEGSQDGQRECDSHEGETQSDTDREANSEGTKKRINLRDNRIAQIGLAEAHALVRSDAQNGREGQQRPVSEAGGKLHLLPDELQRAIAVFPGIAKLLDEPLTADRGEDNEGGTGNDGDDDDDANETSGPRRLQVEALGSLWAHLCSFLTEVIFSITTLLEPYTFDRTHELPSVPRFLVWSAVARLGYAQTLPGFAEAVRRKSEFNDDIDWESELVEELSRKAMQMDPPICYGEAYRSTPGRKIDPDLLDLADDGDGAESKASDEGDDPITVKVRDAYRFQYPLMRGPSAAADETDGESLGSRDTEDASDGDDSELSDLSSIEPDSDIDEPNPPDASEQPTDTEAMSELDASTLFDAKLRSQLELCRQLEKAGKGRSERFRRWRSRLVREVRREQEEYEHLEVAMIKRLDRYDDDEAQLEAEDLLKLLRGWHRSSDEPIPPDATNDGGEPRSAQPREITTVFELQRAHTSPPPFLRVEQREVAQVDEPSDQEGSAASSPRKRKATHESGDESDERADSPTDRTESREQRAVQRRRMT
ncbi:hypothetical protein ACQY0O_006916 [Thecaphora frezii]